MAKAKRRSRRNLDAKVRIKDYLRGRTIRSPALSLKTSEIAKALAMDQQRTWRTLNELHDEDVVDRVPRKRGGIKYLKEDRTGKAFFPPDDAQRKFEEYVEQLIELVRANPSLLTILGCTLNDIQKLTDLSQLDEYNSLINTLTSNGIRTNLSTLSWQTMAVRWWLK